MPAKRDTCGWCLKPLPAGIRADSKFCNQRHRQSAWRFTRGRVTRERADRPMTFAYGDPPYPGKAWKYRDHPDFAGEVDHARLVEQLATAGARRVGAVDVGGRSSRRLGALSPRHQGRGMGTGRAADQGPLPAERVGARAVLGWPTRP